MSYETSKYAGLPQGSWYLRLCAMAKDAPIFGYAIRIEGKTPPIASAGVATAEHALIPDPKYHIETGFTEAEIIACAALMTDAPLLLAQRDELAEACKTFAEWLRREDSKPDYPPGVDRDSLQGQTIWRDWFDTNVAMCRLAQEQVTAALAKLEATQ